MKLSFSFSAALLCPFNIWLCSTWWHTGVLLEEKTLCFFCFDLVKLCLPNFVSLKMESVLYAGPFCLPHEHLCSPSCAETVTFVFFEMSDIWQSQKTNSERGWACSGFLSLCMVLKMGGTFYCGPVCSHFLQEVLVFILESEMQLKKMKSRCEEHAITGRSGSLYLLGDFAGLYNGNRNIGAWIDLVFECFKYLFLKVDSKRCFVVW